MKFAIFALALTLTTSAFSQTTNTGWTLSEIKDKEKTTVGFIYHTAAIGTAETKPVQKSVTGLRLVCSTRGGSPAIAIYWNGTNFSGPESVTTEVDGKPFGNSSQEWRQDTNLTYRELDESRHLLQALRTGRTVKFSWTGKDSVRRATMFSLSGFNSRLSEFSTACKVSL